MGSLAVSFGVDMFVSTLCIYVATQLNFLKAEIKDIAVVIFAVSLVALFPYVGWVASIIVFVYLLMKVIDCSLVDAVWVVVVSKMFSFLAIIAIHEMFGA